MMNISENDNFISFEFGDSGNKTLVLVDDKWLTAYQVSQQHQNGTVDDLLKNSDIDQLGVARVTLAALEKQQKHEWLGDLKLLVVMNFPEEGGNILYLENVSEWRDIAVLVDIGDNTAGAADHGRGLGVARCLLDKLETYQICFFSQGFNVNDPYLQSLSYLYKHEVNTDIEKFKKWWQSVWGSNIRYDLFLQGGFHYPHKVPHYLGKRKEDFLTFVKKLADRDCYKVWEWCYGVLEDDCVDNLEKIYTYRSAKAFSCYGNGRSRYVVPLTFLAGLAHGIANHFCENNCTDTCLRSINEKAMDDILNGGSGQLKNHKTPRDLAKAIRDFVKQVSKPEEGNSRLQQVEVFRKDSILGLILRFTEPLSDRTKAEDWLLCNTKRGAVGLAFRRIEECILSNGDKVVIDPDLDIIQNSGNRVVVNKGKVFTFLLKIEGS